MKKLLLLSAGMIFAAGMASAAITADQLVAAYQADGYTTIEVTTGAGQFKVEAVKDTTKLEVVYDAETGAILKQEQSTADVGEAGQGVEIKSAKGDFVKDGTEAGDDSTSGHDDASDDGESHDMGDDNGSDGQGDDNGGDHGSDHGSEHDSGDHSGSDHSGSGDSHDD